MKKEENYKMPKTIFNTTEKSNFILNMKEESVDKLAFFVLSGICILITLSQIPAEFGYGMTDMPFLALGISAVFAVVTGIILFLRKRAEKSQIVIFSIIGFLFLWSMVSYYTAYNTHTALWGQDGRYDGLVTTILYIFLFFTASMISSDKIEKLFDLIVLVGIFQALWSIYQIMPFGTSYYKNLEVAAVDNVYLTSGLAGSPFFLAMLMTLMMSISSIGVIFSENKVRKIVYTIAYLLFFFTTLKTHTVSGIIGIFLVVIVSAVMMLKNKKMKLGIFLVDVVMLIFAIVKIISDYKFYDGAIVWQDSFFRLGVTGYYSFSVSDFDIFNLKEVYAYLWNEALNVIKDFPIEGAGIDCFAYTQYKTTSILQYELNSIDRPYNDYLFLTATRGIPYIVGYLAMLIYTLVHSIKRKSEKWYFKTFPVIIISFMVISVFNNSAITVMPFMWIILGLAVNQHD